MTTHKRNRRPAKSAFVTTIAIAGATVTLNTGCEGGPEMTTNPPPVECPEEIPMNGDSCTPGWGNTCFYDDGCGGELEVTCVDHQWEAMAPPPCNPPPPPACTELTEDACGERNDCQFLVPGCGEGEPELPESGCFSNIECDELSCNTEGMSCQNVIIDPCYGSLCGACGEERTLCLPDTTNEANDN